MSTTVGVIGAGRMGLPICRRLAAAGTDVVASDRRPEREHEVRATGARWLADNREIVDAADVVITVLPGTPELLAAMEGLVGELRRGTTWIEMTSSAPQAGAGLLRRASSRGVECIDAPLGGGPSAVETGTLQLFAGGSAETVERQRALLETLGSIEHVGGQGAGYVTKLLVNLLWFGQALAVGESLLLARKFGLETSVISSVLGRSAAASTFLQRDLDALLDGNYMTSFGLDRCCEELDAVTALASELDSPLELGSLVADQYRRALERYGPVGGELLPIALLEEQAGTPLRRE